jgi:Ca-activated chloride channel family protein
MIRSLGFAALAVSIYAAGAGAQQPPVFRSGSDNVRLFVTVTDRDGRLVPNLTQDAFEVRDEGTPQPITLFDNTPQPIRLVVLLDVSGSMQGNLPLLRDACEALLTRLEPGDLVRLGTFGHDVAIGPAFTADPAELLRSLPRGIDPDAPTPLWKALDEAMDAFHDATDVRSVVLVLSDGKDSGPLGFRDRYVSQGEVIDRARADDVMIYAVAMGSRGARPSGGFGPGGLQAALLSDLPDPGLARVAEESGGGYIEIRSGQDMSRAFAQVADELHSQYLLGFAPPKRDGKAHDVEVRLKTRGMKPRARKQYVAPKER